MVLFWNVRGLNNITKQKRLYDIIKESKASLVCFSKKHVLQEKKIELERIFPNCNYADNYEHAILGRIQIFCYRY